MKLTQRKPTTTSYVLLTQLALRPWTPYELARQRVRYFRFVWPRAASAIYREVKKLADDGLAKATVKRTGLRKRTVYSITEPGLDALRSWLDTPVSPFALEFEGLMRLFAAPIGTTEQIQRTLEQVQADAEEMLGFAGEVKQEFLDGRGALQDQVYVRALGMDFFISLLNTVAEWVDRTRQEIDHWEGLSLDERNQRGLAVVAGLPVTTPEQPLSETPIAPKSQQR